MYASWPSGIPNSLMPSEVHVMSGGASVAGSQEVGLGV